MTKPLPAPALRGEAGLRDYATAPIKFKKQMADLMRLLNYLHGSRLQNTEAAHRHAAPMLDLLAVYTDGQTRIDEFLERHTCFDEISRHRLKQAALAGPREGHSPRRLGELMSLHWATRKQLKLTNIDAIDTPPAEIREALCKADDAARKRQGRAAKRQIPQLPPAGKRKAERRLAAIYSAVPPGKWVSVTDLCKVLGRQKNGRFNMVSASSMPRVVRRIVAVDTVGLQSELRPIPGRPDLRSQLWVKTIMPDQTPPTNEAEYRLYFARRLAEFTPETAARKLPSWFNSDAERGLLAACCGAFKRDEFLIMANRVRNKLLYQQDAL
jgi:hypothetical protein